MRNAWKLLSLLLCLALAASVFVACGSDKGGDVSLAFEKNADGTGYVFVGAMSTTTPAPEELVIPDTYEGLPVVEIAESDAQKNMSAFDGVKTVRLPDSVTKIGERGFYRFAHLEKVVLGQGIAEIGDAAFLNNSLSAVEFPETVEHLKIGADAFQGSAIGSIKLPANTTLTRLDGLFDQCPELTSIDIGDCTLPMREDGAYLGYFATHSPKLTSLVLPGGNITIVVEAYVADPDHAADLKVSVKGSMPTFDVRIGTGNNFVDNFKPENVTVIP